MENSNMMLTRVMAKAGARNGFEDVTAEFSAFRDFKMKWTRSNKWISFEVCDYLKNAPENVIEGLANTVFARITGDKDCKYAKEVCDYLESEEFLKENQETYLKRFKGITATPRGKSMDLSESYRRLVKRGLIENDPDIVLRWNTNERNRRMGSCSVLMRTVVMNKALDTEDISENALDYALYTQICQVNLGFGPSHKNDRENLERMISAYPKKIEAEKELAKIGF